VAWLLRRSPVMMPIPGSASVAHVEENCAAAELELADSDIAAIGRLVAAAG
jgi:pyridoxine 4-dehydrogenase